MAQTHDSETNHDCLLPWQQDPDSCTTVRSGFSDLIPTSCFQLHTSSCPEIERVAEANEKCVHGDHVMDCILEESDDLDDKEHKKTKKCPCRFGRSVATDHLNLCSKSSRQCHCNPVSGSEVRTITAWGELKDHSQFQNSGSSVSKRKQYAMGSHRLGSEDKYRLFEFQHSTNSDDHMALYRTHHTVADVGRTRRQPPRFGVDVPDPYAVRIKNICSIATSCDLTALGAADWESSCADFNSVISAESSAKDKGNKIASKDKPRRKERNKTGPASSGQAQTRPSKQPGENPHTIPSQSRRDVSEYMREYNEIRRERGLNTLPNIRTRQEVDFPANVSFRPNSDSSVATQRLLYELRSPFTRLLQQKRRLSAQDSFTDDFPRKHSTCLKLSEFLAHALSGGACLQSSKATKPSLKLKVVDKSNTVDVQKNEGVHLPELVCQTLSATTSCTRVVSVAVEDVNMARSSSVPASAPSEKLPGEYRLKKGHMPDLMSIT